MQKLFFSNDIPNNSNAEDLVTSVNDKPIPRILQVVPDFESPEKNIVENKIPTPFKTASFWPEDISKCENKTKFSTKKKMTSTVAISDEFLQYQRKMEDEKKKKDNANISNVNEESHFSETVNDEKENQHLPNAVHDFVVVTYEGEYYLGSIIEITEEGPKVKTGNVWVILEMARKDFLVYQENCMQNYRTYFDE